jgi:ribosomal protein L18
MISKSIRIIQILSRRHTQERQRFRTHIFWINRHPEMSIRHSPKGAAIIQIINENPDNVISSVQSQYENRTFYLMHGLEKWIGGQSRNGFYKIR